MRTARDLSLIALLLLSSCTTDRTRRGYLREQARSLAPPARAVIVIPGFGVTRLYDPVTRRYVWGTAHATMQRRFPDDLDLPESGIDRLVPRGYVGSRGPVNVAWQLTEALRKYGGYTPGGNVHPFHYDWRLSARANAARLSELVDRIGGSGKVDIVTHSAGAIVALTYVKLAGGADRVEHLILIAPTQRGVIDAFRILVRSERFIRRVFRSDMVETWPSVYELLPDEGRFFVDERGEPLDRDVWQSTGWRSDLLRAARRFRDELAAAPLPPAVKLTVIAGDCVPTTRRVLARADGTFAFYPDELRASEKPLAAMLFESGDGTVPVSSALAGGDGLLFCDGHQGIATDPNVHRALVRLLRR
jgi:hypothetical protein